MKRWCATGALAIAIAATAAWSAAAPDAVAATTAAGVRPAKAPAGAAQPTARAVQPTAGAAQPTAGAAQPPAGAAQPTARPAPQRQAPPLQAVRGDHVQIQGKLYSPQALFVLTRPAEQFRRDVIVPQYLAAPEGTAFLPYRLRAEVPPAERPAARP